MVKKRITVSVHSAKEPLFVNSMPNVTIIKYMMVLPLFLIKKQVGNQINENWIRYHLLQELQQYPHL